MWNEWGYWKGELVESKQVCIEVSNYNVAYLHSRPQFTCVCVCVCLVFVRTCSDWSVYGVAIVSLMLMGKHWLTGKETQFE